MNNFSRQNILTDKTYRLNILAVAVFFLAACIIMRLFYLQIIEHQKYKEAAQNQHLASAILTPNRGEIMIHDYHSGESVLFPAAINKKFYLAVAVPNLINDPKSYSKSLSSVLEMDEKILYERLSKKNDIYEPLKHKLDENKKKEIEDLKLEGISFDEETYRYYPEGSNLSQVLGFVGFDGDKLVGRYGLEGYWEKELAGDAGTFIYERDGFGRLIPIDIKLNDEQKNGADFVLTIDRSIQFTACNALKASVEKHGADDGTVVILDPKTGAILAMCNWPSFDPNNYQQVTDYNVFNNPAVYTPYEPGSMIKGLTIAAAMDLGKITPETVYEDTGEVKVGNHTIKNSDGKAHGLKNMTQVLEESLNTGAIYAARLVGRSMMKQYFDRFGFGQIIGIGLSNEKTGTDESLKNNPILEKRQEADIDLAVASFGQGITATPLQVAMAFSAIANGGKMMKPYLIDEVKYPSGKTDKTQPQFLRQVISENTAITLTAMLGSVVSYGHAKRAAIPGYWVAGKTGTAQMADQATKNYSPNQFIHSFIGFAPLENPRFVMLTKITNPKDVQFAESSAVPLFSEIGQFLLNYFKVPPSVQNQ